MSTRPDDHVSADRLQALLDGALPARDRGRVERHVAACARCSEALDSWRVVFEDLAALPSHAPGVGFRDRVMAGVRLPGRVPFARRLGRRLLALVAAARPAHPSSDRLQDFLDRALPARQMARVEAHVGGCAECASELLDWRAVYRSLGDLEAFAPREGFADLVMAAVPAGAADAAVDALAASVAAPTRQSAAVPAPGWRRALSAAGRFVPRTRRAWAAVSGIALTPAVTVGLVFFTVFSHPTLTPQALASFAVWKLGELFSVAWGSLAAVALNGAQVVGVDSLVRASFEAPLMLAGGALAYSVVSVLALRVLYKNLLGGHRYARVSHS